MGLLKKSPDTGPQAALIEEPVAAELSVEEPPADGDLSAVEDVSDHVKPAADAAVAPAAEPAGGDALLQMFQDAKHEEEDRSMFVEMAGDVELADLMEDLQTTAAALGIVIARASAIERADEIAA